MHFAAVDLGGGAGTNLLDALGNRPDGKLPGDALAHGNDLFGGFGLGVDAAGNAQLVAADAGCDYAEARERRVVMVVEQRHLGANAQAAEVDVDGAAAPGLNDGAAGVGDAADGGQAVGGKLLDLGDGLDGGGRRVGLDGRQGLGELVQHGRCPSFYSFIRLAFLSSSPESGAKLGVC